MLITDAQAHVWAEDRPDRPWPRPERAAFASHHRRPSFGAEELLAAMDAAGVDRAVLVPPSWEGNRNDLAVEAARRHPGRLAVMARVGAREREERSLEGLLGQSGVLGLRLTAGTRQGDLPAGLGDPAAGWIFAQLEAAGRPVMLLAPGRAGEIGELAERHPGLRIVVDHLNLPDRVEAPGLGQAVAPLLALAGRPNVAVKVSALPCHLSEPYPFPGLAPLVRAFLDAFGPRRCLWGSDLTRLPCPYADWVRFGREADFLSAEEREWLMGRALEEWLGWPSSP